MTWDKDLEKIGRLPQLTTLAMTNGLGTGSLASIKGLSGLTYLDLSVTGISKIEGLGGLVEFDPFGFMVY